MNDDTLTCPHCMKQTTIYPVMIETDSGKGKMWCNCDHCEGGILLEEIEP